MKLIRAQFAWLIILCALAGAHEIENIDSRQAFEQAQQPLTYLIDVRSMAEYSFVGHPLRAYNIPLSFWDEKAQKLVANERFIQDLKNHFQPSDRLVFLCRSGGRSLRAARAAMAAGFTHVATVSDGFEGEADENGYRTRSGWKNSGLPYTYELDHALTYRPVLQAPGK